MFSGALTMAAIVRLPSVVGPMLTSFDAIGRGGDELEVAFDGVRRGELPIGAHPETEVRLGRNNRTQQLVLLLARRGRGG